MNRAAQYRAVQSKVGLLKTRRFSAIPGQAAAVRSKNNGKREEKSLTVKSEENKISHTL
jgi:hypothetical protein